MKENWKKMKCNVCFHPSASFTWVIAADVWRGDGADSPVTGLAWRETSVLSTVSSDPHHRRRSYQQSLVLPPNHRVLLTRHKVQPKQSGGFACSENRETSCIYLELVGENSSLATSGCWGSPAGLYARVTDGGVWWKWFADTASPELRLTLQTCLIWLSCVVQPCTCWMSWCRVSGFSFSSSRAFSVVSELRPACRWDIMGSPSGSTPDAQNGLPPSDTVSEHFLQSSFKE